MKNISLIFNLLFAITVFTACNKQPAVDTKAILNTKNTVNSGRLPVAYINVDSLLIHYQFAKEANESLIRKQEDSRLKINSMARQLQGEMADFQRKLENNAFLSRDRAQQEQTFKRGPMKSTIISIILLLSLSSVSFVFIVALATLALIDYLLFNAYTGKQTDKTAHANNQI